MPRRLVSGVKVLIMQNGSKVEEAINCNVLVTSCTLCVSKLFNECVES